MKACFLKFLVLVAVFGLSGCALYGSQAQYDSGDWSLVATSSEVARIKQDQLAIEKLKSQPVSTTAVNGAPQGYLGIVKNFNKSRMYNFKLYGPEEKSYLLDHGQQAEDYLLPGNYTCVVYKGGFIVGQWSFNVGVQEKKFLNTDKKYHWYVYIDR